MIKNLVFDMGNVLVRYEPAVFIREFTDDVQQQDLLLKELFGSISWLQYDRGMLTTAEIAAQVCSRVPDRLHSLVNQLLTNWYQAIAPIEEMAAVIESLKDQGYQLYILSNASQDFYKFADRLPAYTCFDGVFVSSDWRLLKPEKEIYHAFYQHFQLVPSKCYFIDDAPANIESALLTGMKGTIFRGDVPDLLSELKRAGIRLS